MGWIETIDGESDQHWSGMRAQSLVDFEGMEMIQAVAEKAKKAALDGVWLNATKYWYDTEWLVIEITHGVDFYNIHKFHDYWTSLLSEKPELQLMLTAGRSESRNQVFIRSKRRTFASLR